MKDIINEINDDHKKLKALYKMGLKKKTTYEEKKQIFEELSVLVTAHAKSEEAVMYVPTCSQEETKMNAFEGFEEHGLVELLMEEMKSEDHPDRWSAKFTVICELLEHHIEEEEEEYLPKLKEMYSSEERKSMGDEYREMFSRLLEVQSHIGNPQEAHLRSH